MKKTKLRYETWAFRDDIEYGIIHHATAVITYNRVTDEMRVTTGGHYSSTTKERLNQYNPMGLRFFVEKGEWFVKDKTDTYPYSDGMIFKNGQLIGGEWWLII